MNPWLGIPEDDWGWIDDAFLDLDDQDYDDAEAYPFTDRAGTEEERR